ncbi:MAG: urease accessory protein UreE [Gammaproteobacteria bacterium]
MDIFDRMVSGADAARTLTLSFERRSRSRQRVLLDDGRAALLALPRGTVLRDGDVLGCADGPSVRVRAAAETVSTAVHADPATLLRAAYHLGNRHVPVQIGPGWLGYLHDHVLDAMCRGLGLHVEVAQRPFEPEDGAYAGAGHRHGHGHSHADPHPDHDHG